MSAVPWKGTSFNMWLRGIVSSLCPQTADECTEECKRILLSNQTNDDIQFPLFELLGDQSFEAIELFLQNRDAILREAAKESSKAAKDAANKQRAPVPAKQRITTARLANTCKYSQYETINMVRYDVEATDVKRPQIKRKPITDCPKWVQQCFPLCETFNDIQTQIFDVGFNTNENMLVCAPTGAGKTNVALLTILHEIQKHIVIQPGIPAHLDDSDFLIVYITPMKALALEITDKFKNALRHLKIVVHEYTGDTSLTAAELDRSHILVATPEKWDVATRRAGENAPAARLKLLIIDEIHLLQDDRGPVLEALVARTLRQVEQQQSMIRIVGLSATLPNYTDVANFLHVTDNGLFCFGPEYRPVPLAMSLIGAKNTYKTPTEEDQDILREVMMPEKEKDLCQIDVIAIDLLRNMIDDGQQVLIFVHTRQETAKFANLLAKYVSIPVKKDLTSLLTRKHLESQLRSCLSKGVGIHHAGLPRQDRIFVEQAFRTNAFQILVCTATLAWGVNLPAHTVIIKGTQVYNQDRGGFEDIGILDVHQMFGRAGRPQFDTSGHAILITQQKVLPKYTSSLVSAEPIESKFPSKLEDFLNAEIALGTVTSRRDALIWARYTFMYCRMPNDDVTNSRLDSAINELNNNLMIRTTLVTQSLQPTHLGQVASIHYIPFTAVRHFNELLNGEMDESELLDAVFTSDIFDSLIVRKSEVDEINDYKPVIKINSPTEEVAGKVNYLLQTYISRDHIHTASLQLDQQWMAENTSRIFDAIFELCVEKGWCFLANFSLDLCKMVENRMWWCRDRVDHPLRQLMNFPKDEPLMNKIQFLGLELDDLRVADKNELKAMLRNEAWANTAQNLAKKFPIVEIDTRYQPISDQIINILIEASFPFQWDAHFCHDSLAFWIFIEDGNGEKMYLAQEVQIDRHLANEGFKFEYLVPVSESNKYLVTMTSSHFLGVGDSQAIYIKNADRATFESFESPPPNLRPLPVTSIANMEHRKLFGFEFFNPIQSQVFFQTYRMDESLLICAPTAAGKTTIAELAILRLFATKPNCKAVYLAPLKAIVTERVADWRMKFGDKLIELTGEFTPDSNAIAQASLIVATPEKWDAVSRGFVVRRFVQTVGLVIIDEAHLLGTDRGHIIEAVVDRMKAMPSKVRFIGLSTCLSNPTDVARFLGVSRRGTYNFPPQMRAVPLKTFIRGFPGRHFCPRMASMNKPLSDAIREYSNGKPTLVFVPSRRQTRLTAFDLISYATNRGEPFYYTTPETALASQKVQDQTLAHCLSLGIGLHHAGLIASDCEIVEDLFAAGKMQLLVATATLAWGVNLPAHFVVIKGTEFKDPKTCQYVPYSSTEMQQMMGRAGRPQFDTEGIVMILCEERRKDFLKRFINTPLPVESNLPEHAAEHANAEIASGRIRTRKSLMAWLKRSFFAIRLEANPGYYENITLDGVCDQIIKELTEKHCITTNIDGHILATPEGRIASIFYVNPDDVRLFIERMSESNNVVSLLRLICAAAEFNYIPVRHSEDETIMDMTPRYKTEDPIDSPHTKAFFMCQYYFSRREMPIPDFITDLATVLDQALRIVGCFSEIAAIRGELNAVINASYLGQMLVQGCWHDQNCIQPMVTPQIFKQLQQSNINLLPQLLLRDEPIPGTEDIKERVVLFKHKEHFVSTDGLALKVTIDRVSGQIGSQVISPHFTRKGIQSLYVLVGDPATGKLYAHRRVQLKKDRHVIVLQGREKLPSTAWIYMMSDAYLGIDQMYPVLASSMDDLKKATGQLVESNPVFSVQKREIISRNRTKKEAFIAKRNNSPKKGEENEKQPKLKIEKKQNEQQNKPKNEQQNKQKNEQQSKPKNEGKQNKPKSGPKNKNPFQDYVPSNDNQGSKQTNDHQNDNKPKNKNQFQEYRRQGDQQNDNRQKQNKGPQIKIEKPRRDNPQVEVNQNQENFAPRQNEPIRRPARTRARGGGRGNIDIK